LADERDLSAADKDAAGKQHDETDTKENFTDANFTDAFDAPDRQGVMGQGTKPEHRAGPGEGIRAGFAQETGGVPQMSVFDGKGNESVVVMAQDEDGDAAQGTGPGVEAARDEAVDGDADPGSALGHPEND